MEATRLLAASAITAGVARVGTAKGGVMAVAVASRSRCCCGIRGTHFGRSFFVAGAAEQKERTSLLFVDRYSTVVRVLVTGASLASSSGAAAAAAVVRALTADDAPGVLNSSACRANLLEPCLTPLAGVR